MSMPDDNDKFRHLIGGGFGQVEAQVGPELYQSQIEMNKAATAANNEHTEMMKTQRQYALAQSKVDQALVEKKIMAWHSFAVILTVFAFLLFFGGVAFVVQMWQQVF